MPDDLIRPGDALEAVLDAGLDHGDWARAVGDGSVPSYNVEGHLRISRADVEAWCRTSAGR